MLGTSQDLLYIVLALCIMWFTVFLCWLLYQAGAMLRNVNRMVEHLLHKLELIADAMHFIRGKMDGMSTSMSAVSVMLGRLVEKFVAGAISNSLHKHSFKKKKRGDGAFESGE